MKLVADINTFDSTAPSTPTKAFCCCGLSGTFPLCDGSQKIARTQKAERLFNCGAGPQPVRHLHYLETS